MEDKSEGIWSETKVLNFWRIDSKKEKKKKVPEYKKCPVSKETLKPRKKEEG